MVGLQKRASWTTRFPAAVRAAHPRRLAWPAAALLIAALCCALWGLIWFAIHLMAR